MTAPTTEPVSTPPTPPAPPKRTRLVRWQGLIPLSLVVVGLVVAWQLLANRLISALIEEVASKALGTQVDVRGFDLSVTKATVRIGSFAIADPFDVTRNLIEAGPITVALAVRPLLEKKVVVDSFVIAESQWRTTRAVPARPVTGSSFTRTLVAQLKTFAGQFTIPPLKLLPIDTVRSLVLDPKQLRTAQAAIALRARTDSIRSALEAQGRALQLKETADSAQALLDRLKGASPRSLGISGTAQAVRDLRATVKKVENAKKGIEALAVQGKAAADRVKLDIAALDVARQADYAFARSLLKLPSFAGPDLSNALFGQVTIDRFQQAMYYAEVAKKYVPAGLLPREDPGPVRLRLAGTTVHFPKASHFPQFHLKRGDVRFAMRDAGGAPARYRATVADITTDPELVGRPITATARRDAGAASGLATLRLSATLDHRATNVKDSVDVVAAGIGLPRMPLPGLPLRLDPGAGESGLMLRLAGDEVRARWTLHAPKVTWQVDSAAYQTRNQLEQLAVRVFTGLPEFTLSADLSGTMQAPVVRINSNLDEALQARMKALLGEELKKGEARARAEVDRRVAPIVAEARARVDAVVAEATKRVDELRARLEAEKQQLDERIKGMSGGVLGLPR